MRTRRRIVLLAIGLIVLAAACAARSAVLGTRVPANIMTCTWPSNGGPADTTVQIGRNGGRIGLRSGNVVKFRRGPDTPTAVTLREFADTVGFELVTAIDLDAYPAELTISYNNRRCEDVPERDDRNVYHSPGHGQAADELRSDEVGFWPFEQHRLKARTNGNSFFIIAD